MMENSILTLDVLDLSEIKTIIMSSAVGCGLFAGKCSTPPGGGSSTGCALFLGKCGIAA